MDRVDRLLDEADGRGMSGWEFGWLDGRMTSSGLPWSYSSLASEWVASAERVLDMGTGGGEVLSAICGLPSRTIATEGWAPNVAVAARRLLPLRIPVVHDEGAIDNFDQTNRDPRGRLAFRDASFDLVINRHEAYVPAEVRRVLRPAGHFLTQQAGSGGADAGMLLGLPLPTESFDRPFAVAQLEREGFAVLDGASAVETMTFTDVGAFAWYLSVIPWMVPGFTIGGCSDRLRTLDAEQTPLVIHATRFWLVARRDGQ